MWQRLQYGHRTSLSQSMHSVHSFTLCVLESGSEQLLLSEIATALFCIVDKVYL